jgi:hypothetical protein
MMSCNPENWCKPFIGPCSPTIGPCGPWVWQIPNIDKIKVQVEQLTAEIKNLKEQIARK